jgi:hypothetical protein
MLSYCIQRSGQNYRIVLAKSSFGTFFDRDFFEKFLNDPFGTFFDRLLRNFQVLVWYVLIKIFEKLN